ncbi:hypothetical protein IEQ34_010753 [Dendrobium chrysotoxum]|uniref:Cation/H(+) antiporter central domain-containing protein n=1 Tax=Dendrobium chrysotoxum TaxID=161865 RepID=A0AAV7GVJ4_DENCH|nr:hypothetical protein IEQ34_010753 [Dendrobium chrysotoxum]
MHKNVIALSADKHCALIILPFHKHQTIDGTMEMTHPVICCLNKNILARATCSLPSSSTVTSPAQVPARNATL